VKIILDTNVFISGVFFSGPPNRILKAWSDQKIDLVLSPEILEEYEHVATSLESQFPGIDITPILHLIIQSANIVQAPQLKQSVCQDPDDDIFIACALASGTPIIVSGDKQLLAVSGYSDIDVITPRQFVEQYL
jgi:putative PIN family toxin of toxin-antitoxin system